MPAVWHRIAPPTIQGAGPRTPAGGAARRVVAVLLWVGGRLGAGRKALEWYEALEARQQAVVGASQATARAGIRRPARSVIACAASRFKGISKNRLSAGRGPRARAAGTATMLASLSL